MQRAKNSQDSLKQDSKAARADLPGDAVGQLTGNNESHSQVFNHSLQQRQRGAQQDKSWLGQHSVLGQGWCQVPGGARRIRYPTARGAPNKRLSSLYRPGPGGGRGRKARRGKVPRVKKSVFRFPPPRAGCLGKAPNKKDSERKCG